MWPLHYISLYPLLVLIFILLLDIKLVRSAVANTNFNENIRKYSITEENTNTTNVRTLLKQGKEQYSNFIPIPNPVTFKSVLDNELSSSSYSRGLLHHADYGAHDYEETPHGHGYEYHIQDLSNYGHHGVDHQSPYHTHYNEHHGNYYGGNYGNHHGDNHGGHHIGHHYKHHDHDVAAKALLWPIAGIALLGAAAALVSNPVLLQLGVVSGRRKRRDTEEVTEPYNIDVKKWSYKQNLNKTDYHSDDYNILPHNVNKKSTMKKMFKLIRKDQLESNITNELPSFNNKLNSNDKYIPIPFKLKPSRTVKLLP